MLSYITFFIFVQGWEQYSDLWHVLDATGILDETLLDYVWRDVLQQKPVLLGLMEKFDLLCARYPNNVSRKKMDTTRSIFSIVYA